MPGFYTGSTMNVPLTFDNQILSVAILNIISIVLSFETLETVFELHFFHFIIIRSDIHFLRWLKVTKYIWNRLQKEWAQQLNTSFWTLSMLHCLSRDLQERLDGECPLAWRCQAFAALIWSIMLMSLTRFQSLQWLHTHTVSWQPTPSPALVSTPTLCHSVTPDPSPKAGGSHQF